jgi:hypothetical protein
MTRLRALFPLLAALLLTAGPAHATRELDALLDRVLAAYGGKEALARVRSYRMEGTVTSTMRGTGPFVRLFARPDRLRVNLDYPGHPETRILDGSVGWRSDGKGGMGKSEGGLLFSMVLQAARADLPWLLDEKRAFAKLLAPIDGGKTRGIELPVGPGLTLTAYVDTVTGRIVRSSGILDVPGMKTNFAADYSDFRSVDGVLFPFQELNAAAGQTTGGATVTKITLNPPLAGGEFRP